MASPFKIAETSVVTMSALARVGVLRLWIVILLIIGFLAMLFVGYRLLIKPKPSPDQRSSISLDFLVPTVSAQGESPTEKPFNLSNDLKQIVMVGLFAVLSLVLLMSVGGVMFAKDANRISASGDILKTVLGFFIGAATGFLR
jgi:hypothetical protein